MQVEISGRSFRDHYGVVGLYVDKEFVRSCSNRFDSNLHTKDFAETSDRTGITARKRELQMRKAPEALSRSPDEIFYDLGEPLTASDDEEVP